MLANDSMMSTVLFGGGGVGRAKNGRWGVGGVQAQTKKSKQAVEITQHTMGALLSGEGAGGSNHTLSTAGSPVRPLPPLPTTSSPPRRLPAFCFPV